MDHFVEYFLTHFSYDAGISGDMFQVQLSYDVGLSGDSFLVLESFVGYVSAAVTAAWSTLAACTRRAAGCNNQWCASGGDVGYVEHTAASLESPRAGSTQLKPTSMRQASC